MKLLLDTHLLLWAAYDSERLSTAARSLLQAPQSELLFSVASLWEIAIKQNLGRSDFSVNARLLRHGLLRNGYVELPISGQHSVAIDALPPIHRDPFDRILIAQAIIEGITLLTSDATLATYPGPIQYA